MTLPPTLIITMAGASRRFREAGHLQPKYRIEVCGRTLFDWSLHSLENFIRAGSPAVFVAQRADAAGPFLQERCGALGLSRWSLVELDGVTDGQATTVLAAAPGGVSQDGPIAIYNIDTYVEPWALMPESVRGDGWIPCFPGRGDGWSFARTDGADLRVVEVREKQRISPHCTIGLYHFAGFGLYRQTYERYYGKGGNLERGERYVAPLYNQLIADGRRVHVHQVPEAAVHPLGTPAEVAEFRAACPSDGGEGA